jgi:hypothetical protein
VSAGLAGFGALRRHGWPLAATLAAHVLLVLALLHWGGLARLPADAPQPFSVLLFPQLAPPPPAARAAFPTVRAAGRHAVPARPRASTQAPARAAQDPVAPAAAAPSTPAPSTAAILDSARRDIGKIDRELRGAKLVTPLQADTAWSRLGREIDAAHIDRSRTESLESYTSPDGETYYRMRMGNKVVCRKTGSAGPPAPWRSDEAIRAGAGSQATLGVANSAGYVECPGSAREWVRH